jgi:hypothetical protein
MRSPYASALVSLSQLPRKKLRKRIENLSEGKDSLDSHRVKMNWPLI